MNLASLTSVLENNGTNRFKLQALQLPELGRSCNNEDPDQNGVRRSSLNLPQSAQQQGKGEGV